jgi:hypothetical protein
MMTISPTANPGDIMNHKLSSLAAFAAAIAATPALAQEKPAKPVSPFILCDGRTGHVGLMETLGRLVAITVTAGLSEVATATTMPAN